MSQASEGARCGREALDVMMSGHASRRRRFTAIGVHASRAPSHCRQACLRLVVSAVKFFEYHSWHSSLLAREGRGYHRDPLG